MNFEFKSTFNNHNHTLPWLRECLVLGLRFVINHHALLLLVTNLLAFAIGYSLYYHNYFIPAVYGSKPEGKIWMNLFKGGYMLWMCTSLYAAIILIASSPNVRMFGKAVTQILLYIHDYVSETFRAFIIQGYVIITLTCYINNHEYHLIPIYNSKQ